MQLKWWNNNWKLQIQVHFIWNSKSQGVASNSPRHVWSFPQFNYGKARKQIASISDCIYALNMQI